MPQYCSALCPSIWSRRRAGLKAQMPFSSLFAEDQKTTRPILGIWVTGIPYRGDNKVCGYPIGSLFASSSLCLQTESCSFTVQSCVAFVISKSRGSICSSSTAWYIVQYFGYSVIQSMSTGNDAVGEPGEINHSELWSMAALTQSEWIEKRHPPASEMTRQPGKANGSRSPGCLIVHNRVKGAVSILHLSVPWECGRSVIVLNQVPGSFELCSLQLEAR